MAQAQKRKAHQTRAGIGVLGTIRSESVEEGCPQLLSSVAFRGIVVMIDITHNLLGTYTLTGS